jgi:glycosyltransferase involved in cell wall biosynthesis
VLSVCIPFYGKAPVLVKEAVESAANQLPLGSELLVLPDGIEAARSLNQVALPRCAHVIRPDRRFGLVGNWNRCLELAKGDLIHILHDDDVVDSGFYDAIMELRQHFPGAGLYATGGRPLGTQSARLDAAAGEQPFLLEGDDAEIFILQDPRYCVGSVVVSRNVALSKGLFRKDFPYCPDEEAFPRYAADGGFAFDPTPLYRMRVHKDQTRYSTWRKPDFVSTYVQSRVQGARNFSPAMVDLAFRSSARRVMSIALSLALNGESRVAVAQVDELAVAYPTCRTWPRFRVVRAACQSRIWLRAVALRRRYLLKAPALLGRETTSSVSSDRPPG